MKHRLLWRSIPKTGRMYNFIVLQPRSLILSGTHLWQLMWPALFRIRADDEIWDKRDRIVVERMKRKKKEEEERKRSTDDMVRNESKRKERGQQTGSITLPGGLAP